MSDSRIHAPPSTIARGASLAGTCLTQTPIFIGLAPVPALENQRSVCTAEAEGIRKRVRHFRFPRDVRDVIEVARGVGRLLVDRRRKNLIAERQHADAGFKTARTA